MNMVEITKIAETWVESIPNERRPSACDSLQRFFPVTREQKAYAMKGSGFPLPECITTKETSEGDFLRFWTAARKILENGNSGGS